jgi:hypothetical protein
MRPTPSHYLMSDARQGYPYYLAAESFIGLLEDLFYWTFAAYSTRWLRYGTLCFLIHLRIHTSTSRNATPITPSGLQTRNHLNLATSCDDSTEARILPSQPMIWYENKVRLARLRELSFQTNINTSALGAAPTSNTTLSHRQAKANTTRQDRCEGILREGDMRTTFNTCYTPQPPVKSRTWASLVWAEKASR